MRNEIPIVDLSPLTNILQELANGDEPSTSELQNIGQKITKSFQDIGFVYLSNHNIPEELYLEMTKLGKEFFDQPLDVKTKYSRNATTTQGYVPLNTEKLEQDSSIQELREAYDFNSASGIFPQEVHNLKPIVLQIADYLTKLSLLILKALESSLDIPDNYFTEKHQRIFSSENGTSLRLLHYPAIPENTKNGVVRCGTHTDYGLFTILHQDVTGGLEVKTRDGRWIKADPIPGTLLVNVGEMFQELTGGLFTATEHRVLVPERKENRKKDRRSIVFFVHPDKNTIIKPILNIQLKPAKISYSTAEEFLKRRFKETFLASPPV